MKLQLREFSDVLTVLKGPLTDAAAAEKRKAARINVTYRIEIHLVNNNVVSRSYTALARDISLTGMGVLQGSLLPQGQELIVVLPRPSAPLYVCAVAMHTRWLADGVVAVGIEFTRVAEPSLTEQLLKNNKAAQAKIAQSVLQ